MGNGSFGTVYLAEHLTLGGQRAIKRSIRYSPQGKKLIEEGKLLMHMNHVGIPKVYDIEEDDEYVYLVEEYVRGESLSAFITHQRTISVDLALRICISLCEIGEYLRESEVGQVHHRDIKPDHIILSGEGVKLLDYGNAAISDEEVQFFGNNEDFGKKKTDVDGQAIKRVFCRLVENNVTLQAKDICKTLEKSTMDGPGELLGFFKQKLSETDGGKEGENEHFTLKIAVGGSERHIGATHFSVSLQVFLRQKGIEALYVEENESRAVWKMADIHGGHINENGIHRWRGFKGVPRYGPGIACGEQKAEVVISDWGMNINSFGTDIKVLILGTRPWEIDNSIRFVKDFGGEDALYVSMNGDIQGAGELANIIGSKVYCFPADPDPFHISDVKEKFFTQLFDGKGVFHHKTIDNCSGGLQQWLRRNTFIDCLGKLYGFRKRKKDGHA